MFTLANYINNNQLKILKYASAIYLKGQQHVWATKGN